MSFWLDLTGFALHQWLGEALASGVGVHLRVHWCWVKTITTRFFGHTSGQARRFYLIDASLLLGFSLILLTGLVISTWLGLTLSNYELWKNLHVFSSVFALVVVVTKIGLHWRWIVKVARRFLRLPANAGSNATTAAPIPGNAGAIRIATQTTAAITVSVSDLG